MASFVQRMIGAAKLDVNTYEEVEADHGALGQALAVVVLSSVASGVGTAMSAGSEAGVPYLVGASIGATLVALVGWVVWAIVTYIVGAKILPEPQTQSNIPELLRTTGFAQAPGIARVLSGIPVIGWLVSIAVWIWMLIAFVIAVRQALDYKSTGRAVVVCAIGWVVNFVLVVVIGGFIVLAILAMVGIAGAAQSGG